MKFFVLGMFFLGSVARGITVTDAMGQFTLDKAAKRVVVLEYTFVDAVANSGVSPVGIADDKDPGRIIAPVRSLIKDYVSVGLRSQPNLEAISSLKPDLIIADLMRHKGVYEDLKKIAPTVILDSRLPYRDFFPLVQTIGDLLGKSKEIADRIKKHVEIIRGYSEGIPAGVSVVLGIPRDNNLNMFVYSANSFPGGLLDALGLKVVDLIEGKISADVSFEQIANGDPDWVFAARNPDQEPFPWRSEPLWMSIKAGKEGHIVTVDRNVWLRSRGISAAEEMARVTADILRNQKLKVSELNTD